MNRVLGIRKLFFVMGASMLLSGLGYAAPIPSPPTPQQTAPDNTKINKGDAHADAATADKQKMNTTDRAITQKIRAEIMKDKSLSTYAHNVKIITQDGKVTLKGPVRTQDEKTIVEGKAATVAGDTNVTSQIEVAPPKS